MAVIDPPTGSISGQVEVTADSVVITAGEYLAIGNLSQLSTCGTDEDAEICLVDADCPAGVTCAGVGHYIHGTSKLVIMTAPGGTLDLTGNPADTPWLSAADDISIYADNILLDSEVSLDEITNRVPTTNAGRGFLQLDASPTMVLGAVISMPDIMAAPFFLRNSGNVPGTLNYKIFDSLGWIPRDSGTVILAPGEGHSPLVTVTSTVLGEATLVTLQGTLSSPSLASAEAQANFVLYWNWDYVGTDGDQPSAPEVPSIITAVPNPFRSLVTITFDVPNSGRATGLSVYDMLGRRVRSLAKGGLMPGRQSVAWDGCDDSGRPVSAGVYWARFEGGGTSSRVLVLMR